MGSKGPIAHIPSVVLPVVAPYSIVVFRLVTTETTLFYYQVIPVTGWIEISGERTGDGVDKHGGHTSGSISIAIFSRIDGIWYQKSPSQLLCCNIHMHAGGRDLCAPLGGTIPHPVLKILL
eukprot:964960-Rhodomonas_salina.1